MLLVLGMMAACGGGEGGAGGPADGGGGHDGATVDQGRRMDVAAEAAVDGVRIEMGGPGGSSGAGGSGGGAAGTGATGGTAGISGGTSGSAGTGGTGGTVGGTGGSGTGGTAGSDAGTVDAGGDAAGSGSFTLSTKTVGTGQGTASPTGGQYRRGDIVSVEALPHMYSYFKGWDSTSQGCPGLTTGCRLTFVDRDIAMVAQFERGMWRANWDTTYQNTGVSSTRTCTWTVQWTGVVVEVWFVRQTSGAYVGRLRFRGRTRATSTQSNCLPDDQTIDKTVDFAPTGTEVHVKFISDDGVGDEYTTIDILDLSYERGNPAFVKLEYTGTGRSGTTMMTTVFDPVR
jgi:hypothetical protein